MPGRATIGLVALGLLGVALLLSGLVALVAVPCGGASPCPGEAQGYLLGALALLTGLVFIAVAIAGGTLLFLGRLLRGA